MPAPITGPSKSPGFAGWKNAGGLASKKSAQGHPARRARGAETAVGWDPQTGFGRGAITKAGPPLANPQLLPAVPARSQDFDFRWLLCMGLRIDMRTGVHMEHDFDFGWLLQSSACIVVAALMVMSKAARPRNDTAGATRPHNDTAGAAF